MPEKADNALTVMVYMVGTELERKHLSQSECLLEIMEGISLFERSRIRTEDPGVRFVAQTGGCSFDPADSVTGGGEKNGYLKRAKAFYAWEKKHEAQALPSCLSSLKKVSWDRNERWEIRKEALIPLKVQPPEGGRRLMTQKDDKGCVSELVDFIRETVRSFPAQQYVLIICGHGGGPLWGFGEDERNDDEMILPSDICRTVPFIVSEIGKQLALTAYASCFMSYPENLISWAEGSRNLLASETDAGSDDWLKRDMILTLLTEVSRCSHKGLLTDEIFDTEILPGILEGAFSTHRISASRGQILSAFCLEEEKIAAFEKELLAFTRVLTERLIKEPIDCFRALMRARLDSQKIDEYSTDLGSFVHAVKVHPYFAGIPGLKELSDSLMESIRYMTLKISHTPDMGEEVSGLLLFFPVTDSTTVNSNWEKYLFSLRESEEGGFGTWPFSGYDKPLPRPEIGSMGNLCRRFLPLKEGILTLGGLFCAIREAGRLLFMSGTEEGEIADKLSEELSLCDLCVLTEVRELKSLPSNLISGRASGLFDEEAFLNLRLRCRYRKGLSSFTRGRGLGYLPTKALEDVTDFEWFYLTKDDGTSILLPVYKVESAGKGSYCDSFFYDRTELLTPVLAAGRMWMLNILFEKGDDRGRIAGIRSFSFASASMGKSMDVTAVLKEGEDIAFLGSVAEGERYEMAFFSDHPRDFVIGYASFGEGSTIKRGSISGLNIPDQYEDTEASFCIRDTFNGLREVSKRKITEKHLS